LVPKEEPRRPGFNRKEFNPLPPEKLVNSLIQEVPMKMMLKKLWRIPKVASNKHLKPPFTSKDTWLEDVAKI